MSQKWLTVVLLTLVLTFPGSAFSEGLRQPGYVPGEILVKFRSGVSKSSRNTAHSSHGCKLVKRFKRVRVDHVKIPDGWTVEEAVATYGFHADVEYAEPNYYRYAGATIPNDPDFGELWGLDNTGQSGGTPDADIDCPEAWDTQTGDPNVVVGVLDSGIDLDHIDLQDNIWQNPGEDWVGGSPGNNGVDDDGNGKIDDYYGWNFVGDDNNPDDDNDHGTHCSGTIGAVGDDGIGISGVNWQVSIMALKMLNSRGSGSVSDEISAIEYAIDNGAQIISASLSGYFYSQSEYDAIGDAGNAEILVVAAAGNDGDDIDLPTEGEYPAGYDLANIIAVAATDRNDVLASFSNYGVTSVDVAAPGVSIYSTIPGDSYDSWNGTSMATPHVSGLAALIWAENPGFTYSDVKNRILYGVDTKSSLVGKVLTGGRINAYNSINSPASTPNAPSDLEAEAFSASQIDLSWTDNASSESGFKIERAPTSGGPYTHVATVGVDVESHSDTGLSEGTTYYYQVRAFNVAGNSGYSNEDEATTYLFAPGDLSASSVSDSRINLSWTDNSAVESGFRIERKLGSGGTYSEIATVGANVTTYSNTDLEASTIYYYRVNAFSGGGNSQYSNEANATTSLIAPSDLSASSVSDSRINLSWTDNSAVESGFKIERAPTSGGPYAHLVTVGTDVESYSDTGLSEGTTYYYQVRAFNAVGNSGYSNESNATTYLGVPGDLSASSVSYSRINLSWTDNSEAETGFRIERKLGLGGTYLEIAAVGDNVTSYSNTDLEASTSYYYRVNAYSDSGNSEYSNEAFATTSEVSSSSDDGGGDLVTSDSLDDVGVQPTGDGGGGGGCFIDSVLGRFDHHR